MAPLTDVEKNCSRTIAKHGWQCISVSPEAEGQFDFSYTVGFQQQFQHPELAIFGLPSDLASGIFAKAYGMVKEGFRFETGNAYEGILSGGIKVFVAGAAHSSKCGEYFGVLRRYYKRDVPIFVLLWPNKQGCFPGVDGNHPQREAFVAMSAA